MFDLEIGDRVRIVGYLSTIDPRALAFIHGKTGTVFKTIPSENAVFVHMDETIVGIKEWALFSQEVVKI